MLPIRPTSAIQSSVMKAIVQPLASTGIMDMEDREGNTLKDQSKESEDKRPGSLRASWDDRWKCLEQNMSQNLFQGLEKR